MRLEHGLPPAGTKPSLVWSIRSIRKSLLQKSIGVAPKSRSASWEAVSELPAKLGSGDNEAFWKNRRIRDFERLRGDF
jgi:hypothetical protein